MDRTKLQSWTKVLEHICTVGAFADTPEANTTHLPNPFPTPHMWKLVPDCQHCTVWGGETATRIAVLFLNISCKI